VTEFEATVAAIDGSEVQLSGTYFYPEGGGQPADRGTIDGVPVIDVQEGDGGVRHTLESKPDFEVGDRITAVIDDAFRTYAKRAHTASHVLYGAGRQVFEDIGYGGFDIGEEKVRVDFETPTDVDDDLLVELEGLTNRAIWDSRAVTWETLPREEAMELEGIAFNTATEEGLDADSVRVVRVEGWDVAACGGTHVRNTREIGPVTVLDRSNPGEGLTRIEFAVGPTAIDRRSQTHRAALDAARTVGTNVGDLPEAVSRLQADYESLESEVQSLTEAALTEEIRGLEAVGDWKVGTLGDYDPNDVGDRLQELAGDAAPVLAATGGDGRPYVVVASEGEIDAAEIVEAVTAEFGGGGGGSQTLAQGGGLDATPEDVTAFLTERAETS
jgi:alanyl-tRNA synthetase